MFYQIEGKEIASASKIQIEIKASRIKGGANIVQHDRVPTDDELNTLRWIGDKPQPVADVKPQPHTDAQVLKYFRAHGGTRLGVKDNYRVEIDGESYSIKFFDGRSVVSHQKKTLFPITGIQAGSEL
jgi:hypothetical protein